jgi:hypothetical protein
MSGGTRFDELEERARRARADRLPETPPRAAERPPAPRLFGTSILALQRASGNAAVIRLLRQEEEQRPGQEGQQEHGEQQQVVSGTVEEIETEELETRGCDSHDHRPAAPEAGPAAGTSRGAFSITPRIRIEGWAHRDSSLDGAKADAVAGTLTVGSSVVQGGASPGGGEFGVEKVKYKVDNAKWTVDTGKKNVDVSARIFLDIGWGVHSLGRTHIAGENDPAVKKETYSDVVSDLTPDGSGRPKRSKYWCQDLTERHEQFHATDDIGRAQLYRPTAEAWLSSQTVTPPKKPSSVMDYLWAATPMGAMGGLIDELVFSATIKGMLNTVSDNVKADGWAWYGAGGENRAYADGKSSYQGRVDAISKRATTEGW